MVMLQYFIMAEEQQWTTGSEHSDTSESSWESDILAIPEIDEIQDLKETLCFQRQIEPAQGLRPIEDMVLDKVETDELIDGITEALKSRENGLRLATILVLCDVYGFTQRELAKYFKVTDSRIHTLRETALRHSRKTVIDDTQPKLKPPPRTS